jgi:hypothetical protein
MLKIQLRAIFGASAYGKVKIFSHGFKHRRGEATPGGGQEVQSEFKKKLDFEGHSLA